MIKEQLYQFVDKSGCFERFQNSGNNIGKQNYRNVIGVWLKKDKNFTVGDMLAIRDDLENAGFKWGIDFYVKKI